MDPLEALKKMLTESAGADEATKVVESLTTWKAGIEKTAADGLKLKLDEAVNETKVKLETEYLSKLEKSKGEADKKIAEEVQKYEVALAKRVKTVLEQSIAKHGEKLAEIAKEGTVAKGSKLLSEVAALVATAKSEVQVDETAAKEVETLKAENAKLKGEIESNKKLAMEATARKNVAEENLKQLKESLDTAVTVTVAEGKEEAKSKPAAEEHKDSKPLSEQAVDERVAAPKLSSHMERMRSLAGITPKKK